MTGGAGMVGSDVADVCSSNEVILIDILGEVRRLDASERAAVQAAIADTRPHGGRRLDAINDKINNPTVARICRR